MPRWAWVVALCCSAAVVCAAQEASWRMWSGGPRENRLAARNGADGCFTSATAAATGGRAALVQLQNASPASLYLYFDIDNAGWREPRNNVYVVVEYFDHEVGPSLRLEYDGAAGSEPSQAYRPAEQRRGGFRLGTDRWRIAVFRLEKPRFAGRQNLGADFRLCGRRLAVGAVRVAAHKPDEWDAAGEWSAGDLRARVHIGPGGQLTVGGFDPTSRGDYRQRLAALEEALPALKALGVTSHEGYVRWNLCEPEPGRFDWSIYDAYVDTYRRFGIKWVPFVIAGPAYTLPDWYFHKSGSQGYVCLEHGQTSDVESLWNPRLREHVARFLAAFCRHYGESGEIESILLGITGNYGEAIYVATGNDWTADRHGKYHTHPGYWAGDPFAIADFRIFLMKKYRDDAALTRAWGRSMRIAQVQPFFREHAPNDRAWLDFCDWYSGSMTAWARFWLAETRKRFPVGDIYLCTGGDAIPPHGSNFAEQCKVAAEVGGGVRVTNEGSDYAQNFALTRWVASAGRQYGAYFSFEPAGEVDPQGVIARIYNAAASGARGLHYNSPNLLDSRESIDNFLAWGGQFQQTSPVVEIGVYYPETWIRLQGRSMLNLLPPLRDRLDFALVSDRQILDGGLSRVKALLLVCGATAEAAVWAKVSAFVRGGGVLLYPDGMGRLRSVEGDARCHEELFGQHPTLGKGRALRFAGRGDSRAYRDFVVKVLASAVELSPATRAMLQRDGAEDGVFCTALSPGQLLWFNASGHATARGEVHLPAWSMMPQAVN